MSAKTTRRLALTAIAATLAAAGGLASAQNKGEVRIAHIYSKTGPLEAYGKQTPTGFMMGLDYATGGTMTVAGKKLVVIEKDDQGKPDLGKSLLAAAYGDDKADIAVGPTVLGRGAGDAAGGRGVQEDPAGRARGGRLDHRRQVEQVHLPHRPQQLAGRHHQRRGARQGGRDHRHAGAGLRLRPRRREGLQGVAEEGQDRARGIPAAQRPPTSPPVRSA